VETVRDLIKHFNNLIEGVTSDAIGLSNLYNYSITGLRQVLNPKTDFGAPDSQG